MSSLNWRSLCGPYDPRLMVTGTELSVATFGRKRFAAYEVRCYDTEGNADRRYEVRDAHGISDDDVRAGKRSPIVGRTNDYEALLRAVAKANIEAATTD